MVDLRTENPSLSIRETAARVAASMKGTKSTNVERLRKTYRALEIAGQLPTPELRLEQKGEQLREFYRRHQSDVSKAKLDYAEVEREAESLGMDIAGDKLGLLLSELERTREHLETLTQQPAEWTASLFLSQGITDPEVAVAKLREAAQKKKDVEKKIEVLRRARILRNVAGLPV